MKERPIIFSGEMVKAILDGRKTQTRRVMKTQPCDCASKYCKISKHLVAWFPCGCDYFGAEWKNGRNAERKTKCPYGEVGDRLWVRETFMVYDCPEFKSMEEDLTRKPLVIYKADGRKYKGEKWKPSIHMPRWASRILLEITNIRVERLQEITTGDAWDEGCPHSDVSAIDIWFKPIWNKIHKKEYRWKDNPWVWIVEFKRI